MNSVSSLLDIDLDYFNLMDNPAKRLAELLAWADCRVSLVVEDHHKVLRWWRGYVRKGNLRQPEYILHVDEHHDMMDEKNTPNIGNFVCHAMRIWPQVRVHWLVEQAIDSPAMWLSEDTWALLSRRFTWGSHRPRNWPKPQLVSVCTSPQFISVGLRRELLTIIEKLVSAEQRHGDGFQEAPPLGTAHD
jgi:hypothetical protein